MGGHRAGVGGAPGRVRTVGRVALGAFFVVALFAPAAGAASAGPDATVSAAGAPPVHTDARGQAAGDLAITLTPRSPQFGTAVITVSPTVNNGNCGAPDETVTFAATPTVNAIVASPANNSTENRPLGARLFTSAACGTVGATNDMLAVDIPPPLLENGPRTISISKIAYDIGAAVTGNDIETTVNGSCTDGCDPGFQSLDQVNCEPANTGCINATIGPPPGSSLPNLKLQPLSTSLDRRGTTVTLVAQVANQGTAASPPTQVEFSTAQWKFDQNIPALQPGHTTPVTAGWSVTDAARGNTSTFFAVVDPQKKIVELTTGGRGQEASIPIPTLSGGNSGNDGGRGSSGSGNAGRVGGGGGGNAAGTTAPDVKPASNSKGLESAVGVAVIALIAAAAFAGWRLFRKRPSPKSLVGNVEVEWADDRAVAVAAGALDVWDPTMHWEGR
jgi:hypothetical protein